MNLYLGVTDTNWYTFLSANNPEDVNFWQPGGQISFKALERGAPFLFKLKYPENAYGRRCAVSGERTVPALEAAHIKPYAESGPHAIANGLLLRSDIHRLFDRGYITVAEDYSVEVSKRIRKEYENGRDYYRYHGQKLEVLSARIQEQPGGGYLRWHNEHVYRA